MKVKKHKLKFSRIGLRRYCIKLYGRLFPKFRLRAIQDLREEFKNFRIAIKKELQSSMLSSFSNGRVIDEVQELLNEYSSRCSKAYSDYKQISRIRVHNIDLLVSVYSSQNAIVV